MAESFPTMMKAVNRFRISINPSMKITPRHFIFKLFKICDKEKILNVVKEKKRHPQEEQKKDGSIFLARNDANKNIVQQYLY